MRIRHDTTAWELEHDRLTLRLARPGLCNRGARFDWTGQLTDILLDGRHRFCSIETPQPLLGSGGVGLCFEFGIDEPVGYEEAPVGGFFPKPGVGLLRREAETPYSFMVPYHVTPFPMETELLDDGASFTVGALPCNGYAFRLTRRFRFGDNRIHMRIQLENTGERPVRTTEYCHNFLQLDGAPLGADYRLRLSSPLAMRRPDGSLWSDDGLLAWDEVTGMFEALGETAAVGPSLAWTLSNQKTRTSVSERLEGAPARFEIWGMPYVVSPELFQRVSVEPGETMDWSRVWTFTGPED